jgi:hypothetical protein
MPTLPEKIEIWLNQTGQPSQLYIDGQEFPWHLIAERSELEIIETGTPGELAVIRIRIPARAIEVIHADGERRVIRNDD